MDSVEFDCSGLVVERREEGVSIFHGQTWLGTERQWMCLQEGRWYWWAIWWYRWIE